ncbi:MAG: Tll0287-like domain-containing protein [Thiotrichales bacterium]
MFNYCNPFMIGTIAMVSLTGCSDQNNASQPAPDAEQVSADQASIDLKAFNAEAKSAIEALGGTLKGELQAAMKNGGPVAALEVCHSKAPSIAAAISAEKGMEVGRVSLLNRNPGNAANDWQAAVLKDLESRKDQGEAADTLVYSAVVDDQFRFMKAIPTADICLNCHGKNLNSEVSAELKNLYPDDKAVGYSVGDLRGAFVVTKNAGT